MMKCRECGAEMYLDDLDRISRHSKDEYWNCPNCQTGCIKVFRCGFTMYEIWHTENNNKVKEYIIDLFGGN